MALTTNLIGRRSELEQSILTRAYGIADPSEIGEQDYVEGLRDAVSAALNYGFAVIEIAPGQRPPPVPAELLAQARLAARNGVSVDTVLRRYCGGNTLFSDLLVEEAERVGLPRSELKRLLRAQAASFDRLLAAISEEYARETRNRPGSSQKHRVALVERLLAGESLDTDGLNYDFHFCHLGLVAADWAAGEAFRDLAATFDCRLLLTRPGDGRAWAWLGGRRRLDPRHVGACLASAQPALGPLAIGEPADGLAGWRLTHRQAAAALQIAVRTRSASVLYADVAVLVSVLRDDLLVTSLRQLFLAPLADGHDQGEVLRETLRAYLSTGRNASSAAAALGVSRQTVGKRLRTVESKLERNLDVCSAELEVALQLDRIGVVSST